MTPPLPPPAERLGAGLGWVPALLGAGLLALLLLALTLAAARPGEAKAPTAAVELLRLQVPSQQRQAWWAAEQESWGPWLERQEGFLGRQLYWDPQRQEGVVLIRWASRSRWKAIPPHELAAVQKLFEQRARTHLQEAGLIAAAQATPPFPLVLEAELQELPGTSGSADPSTASTSPTAPG